MIGYRDARPEDGPALAAMAQESFLATFGHLYRPEDVEPFLTATFGAGGLPAQIGDPVTPIRLATGRSDGMERIIGFAKMGPCGLPSPPVAPGAAELKQLYVLGPWQGAGIAAALIEWALAQARAAGASHMVLSVWAENHRAQRFYARYGLAEIGAHPFKVGEQLDDDRIWSVAL